MDIEKYISEAQRQLNDENNYKKLQTDPTLQHNKLVNDTVERFLKDKSIPTKIADGLITSNPRTPKFYIPPKIHKENNPGRPVISSINCHKSKISKHVDYHLPPIMKEIPSYIKDTNDFINKINNHNIPKVSIFVTLDVKSFYTSIPNPEGIAAVKKAHERYQHKTVPTKVITTFLALILTLNNFMFNSKFYLQIKECAMGTICAPPYANIFMAYFKEKFIYPLIRNATRNKPLLPSCKNKKLRQLIRWNTIEKNKKLLTTNKFTNRKCLPCFSNSRTLCCKQVIKTEHFKGNQTNRTFRIFNL